MDAMAEMQSQIDQRMMQGQIDAMMGTGAPATLDQLTQGG